MKNIYLIYYKISYLGIYYYPYGGMIGDLSTTQRKHPYKYNDKEYETMYGLNTYDYGARQYDGAKIVWTFL